MSAWITELLDLLGPDAVAVDPADLATYENDAFLLQTARPDAVVFPRDTQQAAAVLRIAARHGIPVVPRGAGTSLAGGTVAVSGGLCVCTSRMRQILEVNPRDRWARVQAGVVNLHVSHAAQPHGHHYAPDPSSQMVCTIGGNLATNSGGPHTLKLGVTVNHILGATLVAHDGEVLQFGGPFDDAPDADLLSLVVGSEGTFGLFTEAVVRLSPISPAVRTQLAIFDRIDDACQTISRIIADGIIPAALEMMDGPVLNAVEDWLHLGFPRDADAALLIEIDGLEPGLDRIAARIADLCRANACRDVQLADSPQRRDDLWKARKKVFGAIGRFGLSYCTQDGVVPRTKVPEIIRRIADVSSRHGVRIVNVMHAGDGNIHPIVLYDPKSPEQVRAVVAAGHEILNHCIDLGGSVTGEHGVGIEKVRDLASMFDAPTIAAQQRIREAFDPYRRMNPHKLFALGGSCVELARPQRGIPA